MRRLLILHDSADFGGHERMLIALLPGVIEGHAFDDVLFCYPQANAHLREALKAFAPRLRTEEWPFVKRRAEPYLGHFRFRYRAAVRRLVARERPDVVLLIQGRIENLATAITALPRLLPLVSYIPMAHRMAAMGRSGFVGDRVRSPLYRRPDAFIVPSGAVAGQLETVGVRAPIMVAPNVVAPPPRTDRALARRQLGLADDARLALFLGRLDVAQKGLDLLLAAAQRGPAAGAMPWTILLVGDGAGRAMVEEAAARRPDRIISARWTDRPDLYLSAADVLLLPSRWEGLPLVLLEAMHYGTAVLASPIDVAAEFLPEDATVDFASIDLDRELDRVTAPAMREAFARRAEAMLATRTLAQSRRRFAAALEAA